MNFSHVKSSQILKILLFLIILLWISGALVFFNVSNKLYTESILNNYISNNSSEITSQDVLSLSKSLNKLTSLDEVKCLKAFVNNKIFFSTDDNCNHFGITSNEANYSNSNTFLKITLVGHLPLVWQIIFFAIVIIQILIILSGYYYMNQFYKLKIDSAELIYNISKQVAHDIRSPLTALKMLANENTSSNSKNNQLLINSIERINSIANDLLNKNKPIQITQKSQSTTDIKTILEDVIHEKKLQNLNIKNLQIIKDYDIHVEYKISLNKVEFYRIISNLLNNSIESLDKDLKEITFSIRSYEKFFLVMIGDTGKGIPSNLIESVGQSGFTFGKEGSQSGNGLGLSHAKKYIESIGGKLIIKSKVGEGTLIELHLPR